MRSARHGRMGRPFRGAVAAFAATLLFGGLVPGTPAGAAGTCTPGDMPDVYPVADLTAGQMATGWTVVQGTTPVSFDVEILGVLEDGIAPGIPFILIQVSGPVIDETGGIAAGFSGSPVYIGSELVGAVAYGFFGADQTVGGVTPAESMVKIFDYAEVTPGTNGREPAPRQLPFPRSVRLPERLREAAARATGESVDSYPSTAERLLMPMSVSGLNDRGIAELQRIVDAKNWPVALYRGGRASAPGPSLPPPAPLAPGDSMAGVISTGDLTQAGIGTVTAVCGNLAIGFGHPFFFEGESNMGLYGAEVLTVVKDPSSVFGPFKMAQVTDPHGLLDQDRLTGIRGIEGVYPGVVPVMTDLENLDTAFARQGQTDVVLEDAVPVLTAFHLLGNLDVVFDEIGEGTSRIGWTIDGLRENGDPFSVSFEDMIYSPYDVSYESIFGVYGAASQILGNRFEDISFTGIGMDGTITTEELHASIKKVQSSSSLNPVFKVRPSIRVRPGTLLRLRVFLTQADGTETIVPMQVRVPFSAAGSGQMRVEGGGSGGGYYYYNGYGEDDEGGPGSFDELLAQIEGQTRGFDLIGTLFPSREDLRREKVLPQDQVITGYRQFQVIVVRG